MSGDLFLVYYTDHGTMTFSQNLIEYGDCNAEITYQAAHDLGFDCEILASDRLRIHLPSIEWSWTVYHQYSAELLVENGLDH